MAKETFEDLYIDELKDLYSAENQILKALPKMQEAATHTELKQAFQEHEQQTRGQVQRLEQIFQKLGEEPTGKVCKAMQGLAAEAQELLSEHKPSPVLDAGLIGAAQRVEHYEMAGYGTARNFAQRLGYEDAAKLLQQTLDEEGETDKKLTKIAEQVVNKDAASA